MEDSKFDRKRKMLTVYAGAAGIGVAISVHFLLNSYVDWYGKNPFFGIVIGVGIEIASLVLSLFVPLLHDYHRFDKQIKRTIKIQTIVDKFPSKMLKKNVTLYVDDTRNSMIELVKSIKDGKVDLDKWQYDRFLKIVFRTKMTYEAIDVSLPSQYMRNNTSYLEAHQESLDENTKDYRIVLQEYAQIEKDSKTNDYSKFHKWHQDRNVYLGFLQPIRAKDIMEKHGLEPERCEQGIGVWGDDFAILFSKLRDEKVRIYVIDGNDPQFKNIQNVCREIKEISEEMQPIATPRPLDPKFVELWKDYVNPEKRRMKIKPFMDNFLEKYKIAQKLVIDVAGGIGIEYYYMSVDDGYLMDVNEVQDDLREAGQEYAQNNDYAVKYSPTAFSWSELVENGLGGKFGGLFVIGNSLRVVEGKGPQLDAIKQFYEVLQDDGTIIIDERNHGRFIKHADDINRCGRERSNSGVFEHVKKATKLPNPLYYGTNVQSIPHRMDLNANTLTACFYKNTGNINSFGDAEEHMVQDWTFYHDERMEVLLEQAGFAEIEKYADYDPGKKLDLSDTSTHDDVSMFVYVARKNPKK